MIGMCVTLDSISSTDIKGEIRKGTLGRSRRRKKRKRRTGKRRRSEGHLISKLKNKSHTLDSTSLKNKIIY